MPENTTDFFTFEIISEGSDRTLKINCDTPFVASIEDNELTMSYVISKLMENPDVTRIILAQKRDFDYNQRQTEILIELAKFINKTIRQKNILTTKSLGIVNSQTIHIENRYIEVRNIIYNLLKSDPISAYVEIKRILRRDRINLTEDIQTQEQEKAQQYKLTYIEFLEGLLKTMDELMLFKIIKPQLPGHRIGDRLIYREILNPEVRPDFLFTKLMSKIPSDAEELEQYNIQNSQITILKTQTHISPLYHIVPPEFKLTEQKYEILDSARRIISEHKPTRSEFIDPERLRNIFMNIGSDLIDELAEEKGIKLRQKELEELTSILVRHTIGFGIIELLLADQKIQDITVNSPFGSIPTFVVHQDYGTCITNIFPTFGEGESWATKLRLLSGRPLDEANPILDTQIAVPKAKARVSVVGEPVNPTGLAYAFRRHRDHPWTLPLFIKNKMITPLAAGLISFLVDGARTLLIAGTRSAGKTSFLGSVMTEIMRKNRIITVEDTLELPVEALRNLNYNIQPLKTASALSSSTTEVSADEGIRTTLRLGDSCLILGEVRSQEAKALYEAMRIGALANVVAGTIHGDSPYGVYDRVVNDLGVAKTSFKATDIIIVANPIKTPDGLTSKRRIIQITEVTKTWEDDPLLEKGFVDLMRYNPETDELEPTQELLTGESEVLKKIGGTVKQWAGNWGAIWENIQLRADIKQKTVETAEELDLPELLEAEFSIESNDTFHKISEKVNKELKKYDTKRILFEWEDWLKSKVRKMQNDRRL